MNKILRDEELILGNSTLDYDFEQWYQTKCNIQYVHNILCAIFPYVVF